MNILLGIAKGFLHSVIFLLIFSLSNIAAEASVSISSEVDPKKGTIGDHFFYIVTIKSDNGETPTPQIKLLHPEPFEIINVEVIKGEPDKSISKIVFTLAAFDTGSLKLPEYIYEWNDTNGETKSVKANDIYVEVESVISGKEPNVDAIEKEANPLRDWGAYIVPTLLFLLIIAIVIALYIYYKRQRDKDLAKPLPPEKPYDVAIRKLEQIKAENLYAKGKVKEYFSSISNVLRQYIEAAYNVDAMELTTFELSQNFPTAIENHKNGLIRLLETCDAVKFAKATPSKGEADDSYSSARDFVKNSRPKETLPERELATLSK